MSSERMEPLWTPVEGKIHPVRRTSFLLTRTPKHHRWLATILLALLAVSIVFLVAVPWQQTVVGSGKVTSFAPEARPQTVESTISGRIVKWYVAEGAMVAKGDTIAVLADISVNFLDTNLIGRLTGLRDRTFDAQEQAINVAIQRRRQSEQRYKQATASYENALVQIATARVRFDRADTLYKQNLASRRDLETAQLNLQKAMADSISSAASMNAALQDVDAFRAEEERVISQAFVAMQEADVRLANAAGRVGAGTIVAPIDGTIVRISKFGAGQTVKQGEQLAVIVPTTSDQAVEIYVSGMDAAIVEPGRSVSLQFAGFPAFMFSGWQNVSVGVFHGTVKVIDAVDDGTGRFRLLVVPDSNRRDWPDRRFLRQGTDATGWVMLEEVALGYELWRRVMGFPPEFPVATKPLNAKDGKGASSSMDEKEGS